MKSQDLRGRYSHGAARLRLSVPAPAPHARHTLRDALGLALEELAAGGWRAGLGMFARWSLGLTAALLLALLLPLGVALQPTPEEFEPLALYLEREEPEPEVAQEIPTPARVEPLRVVAAQPPDPPPELEIEVQAVAARPERPRAHAVRIDAVSAAPPASPDLPDAPRAWGENAPPRAARVRIANPIASVAAPKPPPALPAPAASFRLPQESRASAAIARGAIASELGVPESSAPAHMPELPAAGVRLPSTPADGVARPHPVALAPAKLQGQSAHASPLHDALDGVPLDALAACRTDAEEDSLKQRLISAVDMHESCSFEMGSYRFLQMRNLNSFLLWVQRDARREQLNRCGELRLALACLERQTRTPAGES